MIQLLQIKDNDTQEFHNIVVNKYGVQYEKNWGNQERNLVGSIRGTLIGISANIEAESDYLDQLGMERLGNLLNQPYFTVKFYDPQTNEVKTADYTASDVTAEIIRLNNREYNYLSFSLTAVDMWVS